MNVNRPLSKEELNVLRLANPKGFVIKSKHPNRRMRRSHIQKDRFVKNTSTNHLTVHETPLGGTKYRRVVQLVQEVETRDLTRSERNQLNNLKKSGVSLSQIRQLEAFENLTDGEMVKRKLVHRMKTGEPGKVNRIEHYMKRNVRYGIKKKAA